ncbi:hypothetical protein M501DRAFT_929146 [Patellaria atrata CBS 101060]|uniref:R3H domain protein n=1 Tax=Patellaria atrata CBS 101060 TaxID=1346257 RepID=A0A9P4SGU0_9PEZI|nr:hypothetical protein M501DRAFT_929146 [Patellaria atrata CBS 101060]
MYYDNPSSRSPGSHRHQPNTLHRQPSRQFDAYGQLPSGLYTAEDHAARYDAPRYNDRMNTLHSNYNGASYDMGPSSAWNSSAFGQNHTLSAIGGPSRMKPQTRGGRSALPTTWLNQPSQNLPSMNAFSGLGSAALGGPPLRPETLEPEMDEELIPTAIVIKNIPFAVKKEQLVQMMTDLGLPLPYAFNYHFDNGVFRGLAFANFTTADETALVIGAMNHLELQGRKLRVEYKKMLPQAERERIEREKRERRGQLEEQHRPMGASQLQNQTSMSSLTSHIPANSPSPVSARGKLGTLHSPLPLLDTSDNLIDFDLNDPQHLQYYSQLLLFKEDGSRESHSFPPNLSPTQRRVVHTLAHYMGLAHVSKGNGDQRQVHIFRAQPVQSNMSPPISQMPTSHLQESQRRGLSRAATTDFSDVRGSENFYGALGRQGSGLLGGNFPDSPGGLTAAPNLRAAKSYADLRSYTPSPVPSTASFPATLNTNFARYNNDYNHGNTGINQNTTPTGSAMAHREESLLVSGLGGMSLGGAFGQNGSPRGLRGMVSWDREVPGPIGGHRSFSTNNYDDQSRDRGSALPSRQPRGPAPERGTGFSRGRPNGHHNRGSDELSTQSGVEIVVEH